MAASLGIETTVGQAPKAKTGWRELARKTGLFILLLLCAIAVFVFGSNYYTILPTNQNIAYEVGISAFFLVAALLMRRSSRFSQYWQIAYAFFAAALVIVVTSLTPGFRDSLIRQAGIATGSDQWIAVGKVFEAVVTITTILVVSRLAGFSLGSLYIKRGYLKWGLILGAGVLLNFVTSSLMFFSNRFPSIDRLGSVILWGMVFSFANAFMEELWLRGLFLRKLVPLLGAGAAIVLTTLWWSLFHIGVVYFQPAAIPFFLVNLITFGLAYGYTMHKTDSWIAPGLMHAASDFFLFVATLASV